MPAALARPSGLAAKNIRDSPAATEGLFHLPGATFRAKTLLGAEQGELLGRNPGSTGLTQTGRGRQHTGEQLRLRCRQCRHDSREMARTQGQQQTLGVKGGEAVDHVQLRGRCRSDRLQPPFEAHQDPFGRATGLHQLAADQRGERMGGIDNPIDPLGGQTLPDRHRTGERSHPEMAKRQLSIGSCSSCRHDADADLPALLEQGRGQTRPFACFGQQPQMPLAIARSVHQDGPASTHRTAMNHCVLEVEVLAAPTLRYTQDNQTPIAEMEVRFDGLRPDDPAGQIKVVGWGNLAQDLQSRVRPGQRLVIEGRLRMNTVPRPDGIKEKRAEFTLSRLHPVGSGATAATASASGSPTPQPSRQAPQPPARPAAPDSAATWNSAPLVPDTDDIPF